MKPLLRSRLGREDCAFVDSKIASRAHHCSYQYFVCQDERHNLREFDSNRNCLLRYRYRLVHPTYVAVRSKFM